ncbi:MAG: tetratricopeptide repeat protein [Polyangia bacterium]
MSRPSPASQRTLTVAVLAGLLLLTIAVYARGMNGSFQFDDLHTVQFSHSIRHLANFFTASSILDAIHGKRVLTDATFAINFSAAGPAPLSFHLTNLAIHLATTLLVFFFTRRILALGGAGSRDLLAVAVTAVFALHPLQTQAVIYISQRAESLASAFYLGSLLLLLRAERRGRCAAGAGFYASSLALFALGLSAKVIVATLPVAYLLVRLLPGPHVLLARPSRRLVLASPFLAYALSTTVLTVAGLKGEDAGFLIPFMPPGRYFLTQWHVLLTYLRLLFWPSGQNVDWDFPVARGLGDPAVLGSGLVLVLILAGAAVAFFQCRLRADSVGAKGRLAAFGVIWFFLLLAPTSSVVPLADVLMEHRIYLASWGVFLAAAIAADSLIERLPRLGRPVFLVAAVACAALATGTYLRVGLWQSKLALWSDCVAKSPYKARAHLGLANGYREAGDVQRAVEEFHTALNLATRDPRWIRLEIRGKLASSLLVLGRTDEALAEVQAGLAEQPTDATLLGLLAMAHLRRHELPAAEAAAEASVRAARAPAVFLQILGMVRSAKGDREGAAAALEQAVRLDPDEPQGRLLLSRAYREQGDLKQSCNLLRDLPTELSPQVKDERAECPEP